MDINSRIFISSAIDPLGVFGRSDPYGAMTDKMAKSSFSCIKVGKVSQFNVGLYTAAVKGNDGNNYDCVMAAQNTAYGFFGYSDCNTLCEGDEVIFCVFAEGDRSGVILARRPTLYAADDTHPDREISDIDRNSNFYCSDTRRKNAVMYSLPSSTPTDTSTAVHTAGRPTDLVPGEYALLNQYRCGFLGGVLSASLLGGGAMIKLFALENRIRVVADSVVHNTMTGNEQKWHCGRRLSEERAVCLYAEERRGVGEKNGKAYKSDSTPAAAKSSKQTAKPRVIEQAGYYGNLFTRYCLRPDPSDNGGTRKFSDNPCDPGVARESIDPSGQYRLATTGMLGFERIGRIPVPFRKTTPWMKGTDKTEDETLTEFKHDEEHPYYRQLELADRVAYDLKNSYARVEQEADTSQFYVPEEKDLEGKLEDVYDQGFTKSKTVSLEKYDKRRSGMWQGEDGSIILRDAWGSEIVMIGGNIQLSCAGNIQIMPGKSAMTMAGDDIVQKAQHSIDVEAASNDVRINAFRNLQMMAGVDDKHPGGVTIESKGSAGAWDATENDGEGLATSGIFLKAKDGAVVTDAGTLSLRSRKYTGLVSGESESIDGGDGKILMSASAIYGYGNSVVLGNQTSDLLISQSAAVLLGGSAGVIGEDSAYLIGGGKYHVPLTYADVGDIYEKIEEGLYPLEDFLQSETEVSLGYSAESLDKMYFKFRSAEECGTEEAWELEGADHFTLYEPFWVQVVNKFDTLSSAETTEFDDHADLWGDETGSPWPGKSPSSDKAAKYAMLEDGGPANMTKDGLNVARSEVVDYTSVTETDLFSGYKIRK